LYFFLCFCFGGFYTLLLSGKIFIADAAEAAEGSPGKSVTKPSGSAGQKEGSLSFCVCRQARVPASGKQGPPGRLQR